MTRVALAGNPNTGKTSLFNALTGARAHVGNYPGVTVERREGNCTTPSGDPLRIIDVPGCYSLVARSLEEQVAHDVLLGRLGDGPVDVIVAVVDASNLARNLYLTQQLSELGRPVVIALNMLDLAETAGIHVDAEALEREVGVPVVPINARNGTGLDDLTRRVQEQDGAPPTRIGSPTLSTTDLAVIEDVQAALDMSHPGEALWLMTSDPVHLERQPHLRERLEAARAKLASPRDTARPLSFVRRLILARYESVDRLCEGVVTIRPTAESATERIDRVLTHPVAGMGCFILAMLVIFETIFSGTDPMIGLIEDLMVMIAGAVRSFLPRGVLRELVVDGLIAGVGNILVFLPQIVLLFVAIAIMEESGYMARVALLLDRVMRRVGLNGKAFVPLMSSFACAIPGVMAARTIESPQDRLVTILVAPLMSCSARLPVYTLVIGAVFAGSTPVLGLFSLGGLIVTAMYFLGLFAALGMAWVFRRTLLKGATPPLILELPTYQWPSARAVLLRSGRRAKVFVTQTGTVILALSVILWALMSYPRTELSADQIAATDARAVAQLRLRNSFAGQMGRMIEPVIEPLGFDWKIGIALIGSFAAREVLVSTLGQVYGVGSEVDEESVVLREALLADLDPATNEPRFTPLVGMSLMVFFVLAMQCLSTVAVVKRETASWRWPIFMVVYMNTLAWVASFLTFTVGTALGFG